ncbi:TPA: hypothetical protein ACHY0C_006709, partial [Pseudomonas aeruginosa]
MGKLGEVKSGDFAKSGSLFQTFPRFVRQPGASSACPYSAAGMVPAIIPVLIVAANPSAKSVA